MDKSTINELLPTIQVTIKNNSLFERPGPYQSKRPAVNGYLFLLIIKGKGQIVLLKKTFNFAAGDVFILPVFSEYCLNYTDKTTIASAVHFNSHLESQIDPIPLLNICGKIKINAHDFETIRKQCKQIHRFSRNTVFGDKLKACIKLTEIMLFFFKKKAEDKLVVDPYEVGDNRLAPVIDYLYKNFGEDISAGKLAGNIGLEKSYFIKLFKKQCGKTPVQFLTDIRIEHAKQYLLYSAKFIAEIGASCGYNDLYYFSKIFKKHTGYCPTEYRRSLI